MTIATIRLSASTSTIWRPSTSTAPPSDLGTTKGEARPAGRDGHRGPVRYPHLGDRPPAAIAASRPRLTPVFTACRRSSIDCPRRASPRAHPSRALLSCPRGVGRLACRVLQPPRLWALLLESRVRASSSAIRGVEVFDVEPDMQREATFIIEAEEMEHFVLRRTRTRIGNNADLELVESQAFSPYGDHRTYRAARRRSHESCGTWRVQSLGERTLGEKPTILRRYSAVISVSRIAPRPHPRLRDRKHPRGGRSLVRKRYLDVALGDALVRSGRARHQVRLARRPCLRCRTTSSNAYRPSSSSMRTSCKQLPTRAAPGLTSGEPYSARQRANRSPSHVTIT